MSDSYILGQPDLAEQLFRILGLRGDLPRDFLAMLSGGIQLDDFTRPEYAYTRRMMHYQQGQFSGAAVGNFSSVAMAVPNQRAIVHLDYLLLGNTNAAGANYRYSIVFGAAPAYAIASPGTVRDDRVNTGNTPQSIARVGAGNQAGRIVGGGAFVRCPADVTLIIPVNVTLTGNSDPAGNAARFVVEGDIVNTALITGLIWRERAALASELS